jgi:hypothetical protein
VPRGRRLPLRSAFALVCGATPQRKRRWRGPARCGLGSLRILSATVLITPTGAAPGGRERRGSDLATFDHSQATSAASTLYGPSRRASGSASVSLKTISESSSSLAQLGLQLWLLSARAQSQPAHARPAMAISCTCRGLHSAVSSVQGLRARRQGCSAARVKWRPGPLSRGQRSPNR